MTDGAPEYVRYLPIIDRPRLELPDGRRLAFWLSPNIEHYQLFPPGNPYRNATPRVPAPDVADWSYRDYGNRVGFWRMLDVLDRYPIRPTATANLAAFEMYPEICDAVVARDWEIVSHGRHNTEYLFGISEADERDYLNRNLTGFEKATGQRPRGFLGPFASMTPNTMNLLAECGVRYSCDWYCDDQPFPLQVERGRLISLPYSWEVNDAIMMEAGLGRFEIDDFVTVCRDQFDRLHRQSADTGLAMHIALHPFLIGRPHRIGELDRLLDYILNHDEIWVATGTEIADHYYATQYDAIVSLLEERLPLTEGLNQ
jgi:allantoinase